jgi:hypothetical protein
MAKFRERNIAGPPSDRWGRTMDIPDKDAVYYRMREQQERNLADKALVDAARTVHLTLADKYRSLAVDAERREPSGIHKVTSSGPLASPSL